MGVKIRLPIKINDIIKSDVLIHNWNMLCLNRNIWYGHGSAEVVPKAVGKDAAYSQTGDEVRNEANLQYKGECYCTL
jgi:hypothetical protein